jgi:hypothetical protein
MLPIEPFFALGIEEKMDILMVQLCTIVSVVSFSCYYSLALSFLLLLLLFLFFFFFFSALGFVFSVFGFRFWFCFLVLFLSVFRGFGIYISRLSILRLNFVMLLVLVCLLLCALPS